MAQIDPSHSDTWHLTDRWAEETIDGLGDCRGRELAKLGACLAPELVERDVGVSETTRLLVGGRDWAGNISCPLPIRLQEGGGGIGG